MADTTSVRAVRSGSGRPAGRASLREVGGSSWRAGRLRARELRGYRGGLPGALILGAQRAGTTSLYRWLAAHPQVQRPIAKEPQFFSLEWERGAEWYRRNFAGPDDPRLAFEASPYYLYHPLVAERVGATIPTAKCIVLLRDPVARALSHHEHNRRLGFEPLELALALRCEPRRLAGEEERLVNEPGYRSRNHRRFSYVDRGRYDVQVARWRQGPNPLLVLHSADLFADPRGTFQRVLAFLGLDAWHPPVYDNGTPHPSGARSDVAAAVRDDLREQLAPSITALAPDLDWDPTVWLAPRT